MYIFGYGSLVDPDNLKRYLDKQDLEFHFCKLKHYRRAWNVAMDNSVDLPNYKYYTQIIDGKNERPKVFVTFLNIEKDLNSEVLGILFKVDEGILNKLKMRERNYELMEVTKDLDIIPNEKVYTFIATKEAKDRFQKGLKTNCAVISKDYLKNVENAYKNLNHPYPENSFESFVKYTQKNPQIMIKELIYNKSGA